MGADASKRLFVRFILDFTKYHLIENALEFSLVSLNRLSVVFNCGTKTA
jgi:hypothetical protein